MTTRGTVPKGVLVYPEPDEVKESRFGYSTQCLTLATMAMHAGGVEYFAEDLRPSGEDHIIQAVERSSERQIAVFLDSVPLHRSGNIRNGRKLMESIRGRVPGCHVIACGPYCVTTREHETLADLTIVDEAETDFLAAWGARKPVGCLQNGDAKQKPVRLVPDLGDLPAPDRGLLPPGSETRHAHRTFARSAVVSTGRGCNGHCSFCPRRAWTLGRLRYRPIRDVVSEIAILIESGYRNLWLDDDNMAADPDRSMALFEEIARVNPDRRCGLFVSAWPWPHRDLFVAAARAGVRVVSFGLESGSERVLKWFHKPLSPDRMHQTLELADSLGMFTVGNVIVGAPCERPEDLDLTLKFLQSAPIDSLNVKVLSYIRGSEIWAEAVRDGRLSENVDCTFADATNGTGSLPLEGALATQRRIQTLFQSDPRHATHLREKIRVLGPPYHLSENAGGEKRI